MILSIFAQEEVVAAGLKGPDVFVFKIRVYKCRIWRNRLYEKRLISS
jgi:hypothetical protein